MNGLKAQEFHGKKVVDSRDVAEMVGRSHKELLRSIKTYIGYLNERENPSVTQRNFAPSDFFIESHYKDSTGRSLQCYLITKKGCDMIANKITGKKGVLFTAAYVFAFEEMRQALAAPQRAALPEGISLNGLARLLSVTRRIMLDMGNTPVEIGAVAKGLCDTCGIQLHPAFTSQIPGQLDLFHRPGLEP